MILLISETTIYHIIMTRFWYYILKYSPEYYKIEYYISNVICMLFFVNISILVV